MGWEFILVPELGNMWLAWWLSLRETAFLLQKSFRTFAFRCVGLYQKDLSEGPTDAAFTNHHVCRPGGRHVWWDARLKIVYFKHSWPGGHWWGGLVWLSILRWKEESALLNKVRYLVDPASSHMLVSKIKPCMCKFKHFWTVKLQMAHYNSNNLFGIKFTRITVVTPRLIRDQSRLRGAY